MAKSGGTITKKVLRELLQDKFHGKFNNIDELMTMIRTSVFFFLPPHAFAVAWRLQAESLTHAGSAIVREFFDAFLSFAVTAASPTMEEAKVTIAQIERAGITYFDAASIFKDIGLRETDFDMSAKFQRAEALTIMAYKVRIFLFEHHEPAASGTSPRGETHLNVPAWFQFVKDEIWTWPNSAWLDNLIRSRSSRLRS